MKARAAWLQSSRGCCGLDLLIPKKMGAPSWAPGSPESGCWFLQDATATAVWEKEIAVTGHNPIELPPPWCPDFHGSVSQRDAEPLGCTLKFGLAGCAKDGAAAGASQVSTFPFPPNMVTLSHFKMKYYVYLACLGLNTFPV